MKAIERQWASMNIIRFLKTVILLGVAVFICGIGLAQPMPSSARATAALNTQKPVMRSQLASKGLALGSPVFFRIVKTENGGGRNGYLEAFVKGSSGAFTYFKRWDICTWSGRLGPKIKQGDGQSPEGFYFVKPNSLNPHSQYHLSFNLGYPNAYDRAHGRTGDFLMVHGKCASIGCYAMTDKGIEEIYTLLYAALENGQPFVRVHIFPFPMTDENMARFPSDKNAAFWRNLKTGWDMFEMKGKPPNVEVSNKLYVFNQE